MRRLASTGLLLLIIAATVAIGSATLLIVWQVVQMWELLAVVIVGGILVAAAHPHAPIAGPRNTNIHGAARPADEAETFAAARGASKSDDLHERKFSN